MKDLSNVPTAELLTEWGKFEDRTFALEYLMKLDVTLNARKDQLIAELDSRTVGMNLMDGMPEISINHVSILKQMTLPPKPVAVRFNIPLDELIERLKWIKLKPNVRP